MKSVFVMIMVLLVVTSVSAATEPDSPVKKKAPARTHKRRPQPVVKLKSEEEKTLYGVGLVIARQLAVFNLTERELMFVRQGIKDGVKGKPRVDFAEYSKKSVEMGTARRNAYGKKVAELVPAYIAHAEATPGAVKKESGLIYVPVKEGEGPQPTLKDKIKVHYVSSLVDGREMESTYKNGQPDELVLSEFMKCLAEGVQLMKKGGKARLICPPAIAMGKEGSGIIPPDATLVFDMELLDVTKQE